MRIPFVVLIVIHGLIHLMGFVKAFDFASVTQLSKDIPKPLGIFWLTASLLLLFSAILIFLRKEEWWIVGIAAAIVSQLLIITVWHDAKFGTFVNIIMFVAAILSWGSYRFEKGYQKDVKENLQRSTALKNTLLTEADLLSLPEPVQRYIRYSGALNQPKIKNFRIVFEGQMREKGKAFFPFTCEQYNFIEEPTRLFFMKAKMKGVTVPGYHKYTNGFAVMDIRLFGLFSVVKVTGKDMNQAETVTLFNDMCLMAPATLIDKRIKWQAIDGNSAKASFTNHNITITAILYFNNLGQLIDFVSNDRDVNHFPFSTPVRNYQITDGINIMSYGEATWHYPDGKFVYGKFNLKEIEYNVSEFK